MKNETGKKRKIEKIKDVLEGKNHDLGRMVDRMDEFIDVAKTLNSTIGNFKSVRVENLGDIQFPEKLEVSNLNSISRDTVVQNFPEIQKSEILNFPEQKEVEFPDVQKAEITNWPEEKQAEEPSWLRSLFDSVLDGFLDKLAVLAKFMWRQTLTVKKEDGERFKPQWVVVIDPETGQPIRKIGGSGEVHTMVANGGSGGFETVWLKNIAAQKINPSTEETLNLLLTQLQAINTNTDQLELKADTINLNTDTLEAKVQAVRDQLDVLLSTRATETTLASVLAQLQAINANTDQLEVKVDSVNLNTDTLETKTQAVRDQLDVLLSTRASEATLIQVRDYLDTVEVKLQAIIDQTDTVEPKLQSIRDQLDVLLSTRASEATLIQVRDYLDTVEPKLQSIKDQLDVVLSTRASEATLIQVRDYIDTIEPKLQTLIDQTDTIEPKLQTLIDGELWQRQATAGMGYAVTTNNILIANANENDFLLLKNPAGSGKTIRVERIIFGSDENQANKSTFFRTYRDPTITGNGTALTINNLKKGGSAGVMTAFKIPIISARGTLMSVGSYQAPRVSDDTELAVMLQPGENMLITIDPTASGFDHQITTYFSES